MEEKTWVIVCSKMHEVWSGTDRDALKDGFGSIWPNCHKCPADFQRRHLWQWRELKEYHESLRPWGHYRSIDDGPGYKVKHLYVLPGKRLSLQSHQHRSERWTTVAGIGQLIIGDRTISTSYGMCHEIPVGEKHRIINHGPEVLVIIEVQLGINIDESDCIRYEDDYGRQEKQEISVR